MTNRQLISLHKFRVHAEIIQTSLHENVQIFAGYYSNMKYTEVDVNRCNSLIKNNYTQ
jgi:hypothetical protein